MGHASVSTTMIYLHVMRRPGAEAPGERILSPLDFDSGVSDVNVTNRLMLLTDNIR